MSSNLINVNPQMQKFAENAVVAAREKFGVSLDFTESSLKQLDTLLQQAHESYKQSTRSGNSQNITIENTVRVWGSYLGEVMSRKWGGLWMLSGKDAYLEISGKSYSPFQQVYKRITLGQNYDVKNYFFNIASGIVGDTNMDSTSNPLPQSNSNITGSQPAQESSSLINDITQVNQPPLQKENHPPKKKIGVQKVIFGLMLVGLIFLSVTLLIVTGKIHPSIFTNLSSPSTAKYVSIIGNPIAYPENSNLEYMMSNSPLVFKDITIKIKYPVEMSRGETVDLIISIINNSDKPLSGGRIVVWGKSFAGGGIEANYFDGINVSSTDPEVVGSGAQVDGLFVYFDYGYIYPGKTIDLTLNIAALSIGGYRGKIGMGIGIPNTGIIGNNYEQIISTTVK